MNSLNLREVDPERRASVAQDAIVSSRKSHEREHRRQRALTYRDTLEALRFDCTLMVVCMGNILHGELLTEADFARVTRAMASINSLLDEATR